MLEDREISVRINRKDKGQAMSGPTYPRQGNRSDIKVFEDKVVLVEKVFHNAAKRAIFGVCAYVLMDTFRKVVVSQAGGK